MGFGSCGYDGGYGDGGGYGGVMAAAVLLY